MLQPCGAAGGLGRIGRDRLVIPGFRIGLCGAIRCNRRPIDRDPMPPDRAALDVGVQEGDARWFEVEAGKPGQVAVFQFLLAAKDRTEVRRNGSPQRYPAAWRSTAAGG
jgi:hypothetical protein